MHSSFFCAPLVLSSTALADRCVQADRSFTVIKSAYEYRVEYLDRPVLTIAFDELNDLYGGKRPKTDCQGDYSSSEFFAIPVGWQGDLLLAFGISRDIAARPTRLTKLSWTPHQGPFVFLPTGQPTEVLVSYPPYTTKMCWNPYGDQQWRFSDDPANPASQCNRLVAPFGSDQFVVPVNE